MTAADPGPPVVVVGASAGGVEALKVLVGGLPRDFPAAVVVVLHLAASGPSVLPQILDRGSALTVVSARDGSSLSGGVVQVGPPNQHLELDGRTIRLTSAPPHHHHRPSVDLLFSTAAETLGSSAIGVILTGALNDGAEGLARIVAHGGRAFVQDPATAEYPNMPASAAAAVPAAVILPLSELVAVLVDVCGGTVQA